MGLTFKEVGGIFIPVVVFSADNGISSAGNITPMAPVANVFVASYVFPFDTVNHQFAVQISTPSVTGGANHVQYLVLSANGAEISCRAYLKDTSRTITVGLNQIVVVGVKPGTTVAAGKQITLNNSENGTPGGTRAQYRLLGPIFDIAPVAGQFGR